MESKKMMTDRLSDLPDPLILHIMSFMDMLTLVQTTSTLSKRYQNLWKSVAVLDFDFDFDFDFPFFLLLSPANFIDRSLALNTSPSISKLRICAPHDACPPDRIHSWLSFAIARRVEHLHLELLPTYGDENDMNDDRYDTPTYLFSCPTLTSLTLRRCNIDVSTPVCLPALKSLTLQKIELADGILRDILAGCPLLEDLTLYDCNQFIDLSVAAPRLRKLKVVEWDNLVSDDTEFVVYAPGLVSLEFVDDTPRKSYVMKDLSSLTVASFNFDVLLDSHGDYSATRFPEIFDQIRHVKVLKLCTVCIVELAIKEIEDSNTSVTFGISTLVLNTGFCKFELPGLAYMLRSFVSLEVLVINVKENDMSDKFEVFWGDEYESDGIRYWNSVDTAISDMLQHIKTVEVRGICMAQDVEKQGNAITQKTNQEVVDIILKGKGNMIEFLRILLKNSGVLKKLSITTKYRRYYANLVFSW